MGKELKGRSRTETPRTKHESVDEKTYLNDLSKLVKSVYDVVSDSVHKAGPLC